MRHLQPQTMLSHTPNGLRMHIGMCAITGVRMVQLDCGASTTILSSELMVMQVEGSKDWGKALDWAEGAEVEAEEWAGKPDPAELDAWHREPSPEASRPAPDAAQAVGDAPPHGGRLTLPCNSHRQMCQKTGFACGPALDYDAVLALTQPLLCTA